MRFPITPLCRDYLAIFFVERFELGDDDEPTVARAITIGPRHVEVPDALVPRFRELLVEAINADDEQGEPQVFLNAANKLWSAVCRV